MKKEDKYKVINEIEIDGKRSQKATYIYVQNTLVPFRSVLTLQSLIFSEPDISFTQYLRNIWGIPKNIFHREVISFKKL